MIDAHYHVWDPAVRRHGWLDELPELRRRFGQDDFRRAAGAQQVTGGILVQVLADTAETEDFLASAAAGPAAAGEGEGTAGPAEAADAASEGNATAATAAAGKGDGAGPAVAVAGVVGWLDLAGPDVPAEIARLRERPGGERLVGIRHLVQGEADPAWLDRAGVRQGLRAVGAAGLVYDLLVRGPQLPAALRVTSDLDSVVFVVDHAAKPPVAAGLRQPWTAQMTELAARPNVVCKVSGLVTEAGPEWRWEQFVPYTDMLLAEFGPRRLMFGSDWPVCTAVAAYGQVVDLARQLLSRQLGPAELDEVFAGTARSVYGLAGRPGRPAG